MDTPVQIESVGIVGLGDQGTPIAERLIAHGGRLRFFARRGDVIERFEQRGATFATLPEIGKTCDAVLLVVVDAEQVCQVALEGGLLDQMRPGSILVIHSTIHPERCRGIGALAADRHVHVIDAPVSGGRDRSYAGDLLILAGGERPAVDAMRPVFAAYASRVAHMGALGAGQTAKLLNNYFYAAHLATAAKAIELVEALGLDKDAAAVALPHGSGASAVLAMQAARGFERSRHDKGSAYALQILSQAVAELRELAAISGVQMEPFDALVEYALAGEGQRANAESADRPA